MLNAGLASPITFPTKEAFMQSEAAGENSGGMEAYRQWSPQLRLVDWRLY
jgi:hypothetical protein